MALSARERLHQLIDKLPDEKVITLLDDLQEGYSEEQRKALNTLAELEKLREEIFARQGYIDNQVVLDEIREEPTDERLGRK